MDQKSSILAAEEVIQTDDRGSYENEQLRNINRYYFLPYLDEEIPYKEAVRARLEERRGNLKKMVSEWNGLREIHSNQLQDGDDLKGKVLE